MIVRVRDAAGKRVAGARLSIGRELESSDSRDDSACTSVEPCVTDANGVATVALPAGIHHVSAHREGFAEKEVRVAVSRGQKPVDLTLGEGAEVSGVVRYDDEAPAANVSVSTGAGDTRTAEDGSFSIRGVEPGPAALHVLHPVHGIHVPAAPVTAPATDVVVTIPRPGEVRGRVIDRETGEPVTAFRVAIGSVTRDGTRTGISSHGPPWKSFVSEDGTFILSNVPPGAVEVLAAADGYIVGREERVPVESGETVSGVDVALERGVRFAGRVVSEDGIALSGARITLRSKPWRQSADDEGRSAVSGDNGAFSFGAVEPGEHSAYVSRVGFVPTEQTVSLRDSANREEFRLATAYTISGHVIDDAGQPVAQAEVTARSPDGRYAAGSARTDVLGRFTLEGVPAGAVDLVARKRGSVPATTAVVEAKTAGSVTITLSSGGVVSGRLVGLEDAELRFARVVARIGEFAATASAGSDGTFRITGVAPGLATVVAHVSDLRSEARAVEVRNAEEARVDLEFHRDFFTVRGRVTSGGKPVSAPQVTFMPSTPGRRAVVAGSSGIAGEYEVRLKERGEYRVRVSRSAAGSIVETHHFTAHTTRDFDLPEGSIRGSVVDAATGTALADVAITAQDPKSRSGAGALARTGSDGMFIAPAGPGRSTLIARKPGYGHAVTDVDVIAGAQSVVRFRLRAAEGLTVRMIDSQTGAPVHARVYAFDAQDRIVYGEQPNDRSHPLTLPLGSGRYILDVRPESDLYLSRRMRVSAPAEVTVPMERAASLVVVLRAPTSHRISVLTPERHTRASRTRGAWIDPGTSRFGRIEPGATIVDLLDEAGEVIATRTVTFKAGEEVRLELP